MRVEGERTPAVDADRLEHREAAEQAQVVGMDDRLGRIDDAAPEHRDDEQALIR